MKFFFITAFSVSLLIVSCNRKDPVTVTCEVVRTDYRDEILVPGTIQAVNNLTIMAPRYFEGPMTVKWVRPEGTRVVKGDTVIVLECLEIEKALDNLNRNIEELKAELAKAESQNQMTLALLEAQLKENEAAITVTQLDSIQMKFAPPVRQKILALELRIKQIQEQKLKRKLQAEEVINESGIRQLKSRIVQAENQAQGQKAKIDNLTIRSLGDGLLAPNTRTAGVLIMGMGGEEIAMGGYPKPGSEVYSFLPLMSIPDLSKMQILLEVQEVDFKRIESGQKVAILVDASGRLETTGVVKQKMMTGKEQYSRDSRAKLKYFEVLVSVDSCDTRMIPGLSARCTVLVNEVKDTVVVPSMAVFDRDSLKVVYVENGKGFRAVPVKTGQFNSSRTIISEGLKGGETIALIQPPKSKTEPINTTPNEK